MIGYQSIEFLPSYPRWSGSIYVRYWVINRVASGKVCERYFFFAPQGGYQFCAAKCLTHLVVKKNAHKSPAFLCSLRTINLILVSNCWSKKRYFLNILVSIVFSKWVISKDKIEVLVRISFRYIQIFF